jgi:hypothetical protein
VGAQDKRVPKEPAIREIFLTMAEEVAVDEFFLV